MVLRLLKRSLPAIQDQFVIKDKPFSELISEEPLNPSQDQNIDHGKSHFFHCPN